MTRFAIRVNDLLKQKGMTQKDLAAATGLSEPNISRYLSTTKRIPADAIERVADALSVSYEDLAGFKNERIISDDFYTIRDILLKDEEFFSARQKIELIEALFNRELKEENL